MHFEPSEQQLQADLIWAATSPDMMDIATVSGTTLKELSDGSTLRSVSQSPANAELYSWLKNNDLTSIIRDLLQQNPSHRLGIYYEQLWQTILEHYPGFQLITKNLPITDDQRTLGEMDFIYFCRQRQRHIHLETAVKFYLGVSDSDVHQLPATSTSHWSQWLGPGCKDRLDIKFNRMLDKQTRISTTMQGISKLKELGIIEPLREICLKGYFFYPLNKTMLAPLQSHQNHARAHWLTLQDINLLDQSATWHIMKKAQWLAPVLLNNANTLLSRQNLKDEIETHFSSNPFPMMVAKMQTCKGTYLEQARYFITPDDWPNG